mmetsp:Transcript_31479/g.81425  ORF Transcript_31479/g.81425 Transcript_31479/m.81425 type:complete len:363 (-) Transcript_31479:1460-2548(-)
MFFCSRWYSVTVLVSQYASVPLSSCCLSICAEMVWMILSNRLVRSAWKDFQCRQDRKMMTAVRGRPLWKPRLPPMHCSSFSWSATFCSFTSCCRLASRSRCLRSMSVTPASEMLSVSLSDTLPLALAPSAMARWERAARGAAGLRATTMPSAPACFRRATSSSSSFTRSALMVSDSRASLRCLIAFSRRRMRSWLEACAFCLLSARSRLAAATSSAALRCDASSSPLALSICSRSSSLSRRSSSSSDSSFVFRLVSRSEASVAAVSICVLRLSRSAVAVARLSRMAATAVFSSRSCERRSLRWFCTVSRISCSSWQRISSARLSFSSLPLSRASTRSWRSSRLATLQRQRVCTSVILRMCAR